MKVEAVFLVEANNLIEEGGSHLFQLFPAQIICLHFQGPDFLFARMQESLPVEVFHHGRMMGML
jgi:hypothetical protein